MLYMESSGNGNDLPACTCTLHLEFSDEKQKITKSGADPEFGKRGGTLLQRVEEQKKKKKKVTTIIASYPLPNILYHVCYVK